MIKICEYVLTRLNFAKGSDIFDIDLPSGSKILRHNYYFSNPRKIFYLWNAQNNSKTEKHWIYCVKHQEKGVMLNESVVNENDLIKTIEVNGETWHIFEIKKNNSSH
jgi:hypothetical protein